MKESRYNVAVLEDGRRWIYNGVSGRTVAVEPARWEAALRFVAGDDGSDADADLLRTLVTARMLVDDDADEIGLLQQRHRRSQHDTRTFALTVVTSLGCNFDCPYCFEAKTPSLLEPSTQDLLVDLVDVRLRAATTFSVTWFGGEPLLGLDALLRLSDVLIARADDAGVDYTASIVTNGSLLTADVARSLRERRVSSAQVTLDGPPEIHDLMRPLASGRPTFETVLDNIVAVADLISVAVRVNLDSGNVGHYERLLNRLAATGLADRIAVYPGQIVAIADAPAAPSATYRTRCLSTPEFAVVEREFAAAAAARGFRVDDLPTPTGAPCTAVRANELVVGSRGEIYKCIDSVGNPEEVVGHLHDGAAGADNRALKWLRYDPFDDAECRTCIALPVCMGGCAHHALTGTDPDARCSTFRWTHARQVIELARRRPRAIADGPAH